MPFVADAPSASTKGFFQPDEEKSLAGFGNNLVQDVKQTGSGILDLGQGLMEHPVDTVINTAKALPGGLINEGKRLGVGELITGHPINAAGKFLDAAYEKPLTTAMDVAPAVGAAGKALGFGSKAAEVGELGAQAQKMAMEAGPAESAVKTAADVAPEASMGAAASETPLVPMGGASEMSGKSAIGGIPEAPASKAPTAKLDPLKEVTDYVASKYGKAAENPNMAQTAAKYLQEEARKIGGKDLGLQGLQVRQMGEGFKGIEKAEALIDYAREKGYFKPGLTDVARKGLIKQTLEKTGNNVGAIRDIADTRATPPIGQYMANLKDELVDKYGMKAPGEVEKTLALVQDSMEKNPTFSGVSEISTDLNKELRNVRSMGRHTGPNTDAADILSRMNNDAIRGVLNEKESQLYTDSLRDYGAHKKLEKVVAGAERRNLAGRSPRDLLGQIWQGVMDRGGYRVAGNVADRTAKAIIKDPTRVRTLPQFFEELAHQADDVIDESLDRPQMAHGGIVGAHELNDFLESKYGQIKETQK